MIPRVLEPEVMDTEQEAREYDAMDHSHVNRVFVDDLLAALSAIGVGTCACSCRALEVLDVGTGTALIPLELCQRPVTVRITAIDMSAEMLRIGRRNVQTAGLCNCVYLQMADAKAMPYADASFDAVISNSIIHHIPEPRAALAEMFRLLRPGGVLFIRDLMRPTDELGIEQIVQTYADGENADQQQLFRQSLWAALTVEEVCNLLAELRLPQDWVRATSDRHWTICGRR